MTEMSDATCCQHLRDAGPSPFEVVMLGWHDGITSGMARCRVCGRTYHFDLVAWDADQEVRVYAFKAVSSASYDAVARLQARPTEANDAMSRGDEITLRVRDALATAFERKLLVAATDVAKYVLSARSVGFEDWSAMLGMA
jgi:hypothetical protein